MNTPKTLTIAAISLAASLFTAQASARTFFSADSEYQELDFSEDGQSKYTCRARISFDRGITPGFKYSDGRYSGSGNGCPSGRLFNLRTVSKSKVAYYKSGNFQWQNASEDEYFDPASVAASNFNPIEQCDHIVHGNWRLYFGGRSGDFLWCMSSDGAFWGIFSYGNLLPGINEGYWEGYFR